MDELPYHNYTIAAGASVGLAVFTAAYFVYAVARTRNKTESFNFFPVLNTAAGAVLGFTASFVVHVTASAFGLINAGLGMTLFDSGVAAFFGGCIGFGLSVIMNEG